ncbi:amidohydrolase family protein [Shewanella sp. C32]|uniref:Amidohydrolase family protein n=1 Tax=Shewanella electrica TaxID=515560 RepID=A0ABT2FJ62_9GAMM|nr:amidohydrolase family protein [Shewanella electrica]MCH1924469.1 amidohydrolase family protein [Shewanella electrica]MCS4556370.1 amidohydrolase family protein [Shewanella electrica]
MKISLLPIALLSAASSIAYAGDGQQNDNTPKLTALTHATVVLAPGKQLSNATVLIENNRIKAIVKDNDVPAGAFTINLNGYTVYPGFIDPYTNYGIEYTPEKQTYEPPIYEIKRIGGNAANGAIHAEKEWFSYIYPNDKDAQKWRCNGFTSVQSAVMDGIFRGTGVSVSLANKTANQVIYKARTHHFISFDKGSSPQDYPDSLMGSMALIRQTFSDARWYNESVAKAKSYPEIAAPEFNIALEALANVKQTGAIFAADDLNSELRAAKLLNEENLPVHLLGNGQEYARIDELQQYRPQLIVPLNYPAAPDVTAEESANNTSLASLRHWERAPSNAATIAAHKIPFAFTQYGIDADAFWPRLKMAVAAGLSEQQALAALTTDAAAAAGIDNMVGKIAPGYMADLVIAKGNLFTDGHIVSVWTQGEEHKLLPSGHVWQGEYQLRVGELELTLNLNVPAKGSVTGTLTAGDEDVQLQHLQADEQRVSFSAELSQAGLTGVSRMSLWRDQQGIQGRLITADGSVEPINGQVQATTANDTTSNTPPAPSYASKLVHPLQAFGVEQLPQQENLLFKHATVWTSAAQGVLPDTDVLVTKGKIRRIGKDLDAPSGYQVIDATGLHLTAGIIDEHSHIAINGGVNEGTDAVTAEVRIGDVVDPNAVAIYRSLAGGVTTANLLHGSANPIGGQSQVIQLRWGETAEGLKFEQARPGIKFALGENVKQSNWGERFTKRFPQTRMGVKALFTDAFNAAREYHEQRDDYAELRSRDKRKTLEPRPNLRLEAVEQVLNSQRDVHIHSYVQSEILMFLRLAEQFDFRVKTFTHVLEGYKVAPELAAHGAMASTFADWWAYKFEVYDAIPQNACLMARKGVVTSINSDDNEMQRRLNQEAAKSIMYCDMPPEEAWKMVTINPAKQLGVDQLTGSIEEGKQADLVLWDHNPLSAYAKTQAVWIDGKRYFDRAADEQRTQAIAVEKAALIQKVLSSDDARKQGETSRKPPEPIWHCDTDFHAWNQQQEAL